MILGGFQKFTLIDYPKKVAAIVFTIGCNFRCGYCYNVNLVLPKKIKPEDEILEKDFFDFLESRKNKLDAVVVTGGEPTLQKDLENFIAKIKKMGFLVKLDTNGTNPDVLKKLIDKKLIDYVAMDIKNNINDKAYQKIVCTKPNMANILKSVEILLAGKVDYEFRTTVAPGVDKKDILALYSSISSGSAPSDWSCTNFSCRLLKESEMYLRKMRPRTTCLYSAASILERNLSAAAQSVFSSSLFSAIKAPWECFGMYK